MQRGIETGDGWFFLIDALCTVLQWEADHGETPQPVATQVKEKLGSLRFRLRQPSERQRGMVALALEVSTRLCVVCGGAVGSCTHGKTPHVQPDNQVPRA